MKMQEELNSMDMNHSPNSIQEKENKQNILKQLQKEILKEKNKNSTKQLNREALKIVHKEERIFFQAEEL